MALNIIEILGILGGLYLLFKEGKFWSFAKGNFKTQLFVIAVIIIVAFIYVGSK